MAKKATKAQKDALESLSYIDTLITILGDYPETSLPLSIDVNPFAYLINICKSLGIFDELLLFVVKLIQYELPLIELGVKGILLANLKEMVSCSSDPFIPNYLRKQISSNGVNSGITFHVSDIDYNNLLRINPLNNGAEYYYLGIDRQYKADYRIYNPVNGTQTVKMDTGSQCKEKAKADEWVSKHVKKLTSKYKDTDLFKYEISGTVNEIQIEVTKRKKTVLEKRYVPYVEVTSIPKTAKQEYEHFTKIFTTYADAQSFITNKNFKYKKKYKKEKTPFVIDSSIKNVSDTTPYELARAKDFNAFLWFATHMAGFDHSTQLKITGDGTDESYKEQIDNQINIFNAVCQEKPVPLGVIKANVLNSDTKTAPSLLGAAFNISDDSPSAIYDLCIKGEHQSDGGIEYTIVPATSDKDSVNWYGDRGKYFDFLKYWASPNKEAKESPRRYGKEIGICNIEFDSTVNSTSQFSTLTRDQIRFTILPKPLVHIPQFLSGEIMPWKYKTILFNQYGELDPHGKYSCFVERYTDTRTSHKVGDPIFYQSSDYEKWIGYYNLRTNTGGDGGHRLWIPKKWSDGILIISRNDETVSQTMPFSYLYECYPNLTVYDFNYDYIMSQRLFDPKVLTGELIESVLNVKLGMSGSLDLGLNHTVIEGTLRQVIIDLLENDVDAYSANDCYTSFSNEKYDTLLNQTEQKKAQGYHFDGNGRTSQVDTDSITAILNEYDNPDITQEGQVDVLTRTFQQAMVSITAETEDTETWDIKFNFISQLIKDLTFSITKSILTPKILMIIMINKQLMGDDTEWTGDIEQNLLGILMNVVSQIVKEIKDMILKELLDFVLSYLKPKFEELAALVAKEYIEQYRDQIKALISACGTGWGSGAATADTKLDKVTYADIDPTEEITTDNVC